MKVTHTHRGHCQICLHVHAIDVHTGVLAKHGYEVTHGYFNGTCPGSGLKSLHVERVHTDRMIADLRTDALAFKALAKRYEAGTDHPPQARSGKTERRPHPKHGYMETHYEMVPFKDAPALYQQDAIKGACDELRRKAEHYEWSVKQLTEWAKTIYDEKRPAYDNKEFDNGEWKVGDTVRIGGKKGFDAVIEAIEDQDYRTYGFSRRARSVKIPHGKVTRPAIPERKTKDGYVLQKAEAPRTYWEPLRNIKRPKVALVEALREAGLID